MAGFWDIVASVVNAGKTALSNGGSEEQARSAVQGAIKQGMTSQVPQTSTGGFLGNIPGGAQPAEQSATLLESPAASWAAANPAPQAVGLDASSESESKSSEREEDNKNDSQTNSSNKDQGKKSKSSAQIMSQVTSPEALMVMAQGGLVNPNDSSMAPVFQAAQAIEDEQKQAAATEAAEREANKYANYVSPYEQVLESNGVIEASNLNMPSGRQMESLTPEQQRRWAVENAVNLVDTMTTGMPFGKAVGSALKAAKADRAMAKTVEEILRAAYEGEKKGNAVAKAGKSAASGKVSAAERKAIDDAMYESFEKSSGKAADEALTRSQTNRMLHDSVDPNADFYNELEKSRYFDTVINTLPAEERAIYNEVLKRAGNGKGEAALSRGKEAMSYPARNAALEQTKESVAKNMHNGVEDIYPELLQTAQSASVPARRAILGEMTMDDSDINGYTPNQITPEQWNDFIGTEVGQDFIKNNSWVAKALQDKGYNATYVDPETGEEAELIYGMTPSAWNELSQRDQFMSALENDADLKEYYKQYGDDIVGDFGYEAFRNLGDMANYESKRDITSDLFGYGEDPSRAISGWQERAMSAIPGLQNMTPEEATSAIMDYMWGAENIINPYQYMSDEAGDYIAAHSLGYDPLTIQRMGEYLTSNYALDEPTENLIAAFVGQDNMPLYPGLNNADIGEAIMANELLQRNLSGFSDKDFDYLNEALGLGGENQLFGFIDSGKYGTEWNKRGEDWKQSNKNYSPYQLMYSLKNGVPLADIYNGVGNEEDWLLSYNLADDLAAAIQEQTGKEVGRRYK